MNDKTNGSGDSAEINMGSIKKGKKSKTFLGYLKLYKKSDLYTSQPIWKVEACQDYAKKT